MDLLRAGLSPRRLASAVALGVASGLVPTFGIATLVSLAVGLRLRLNLAAMQLAAVPLVVGLYFGLRALFRQVLVRQLAAPAPAGTTPRP